MIMAARAPEHAFPAGTSAAPFKSESIIKRGSAAEVITEAVVGETFWVRIKVLDADAERGAKSCAALME